MDRSEHGSGPGAASEPSLARSDAARAPTDALSAPLRLEEALAVRSAAWAEAGPASPLRVAVVARLQERVLARVPSDAPMIAGSTHAPPSVSLGAVDALTARPWRVLSARLGHGEGSEAELALPGQPAADVGGRLGNSHVQQPPQIASVERAAHDWRVASPARPSKPGLKAVDLFRPDWTHLAVKKRLGQARRRVPQAAGPLNSHGLLSRVLEAMGQASPAYVQRFLPYAEALVRLEDQLGTAAPEGRDVVADPAVKAGTSKADTRRRSRKDRLVE